VRDFELLFDNGTLGAFTASVGAEKQNVHVCISPLMKLSVVRCPLSVGNFNLLRIHNS
jgi:hypothetical protein